MKTPFTLLLLLILTSPAFALGPLFFTPEERRAIEKERGKLQRGEENTPPHFMTVHLAGFVFAPLDRRGAWLNHRFVREGEKIAGYQLRVYRNGVLLIDERGNATALSPGKTVALP